MICSLCGETADDVSTRYIDERRQRKRDMDVPDGFLNDEGELVVKEYEHGRSTSSMSGPGLLGPTILVERRCTAALEAVKAARHGNLPKPIAPSLAEHRTEQGEPDAPSAGCGTYPHVGERQVHVDLETGEVEEPPEEVIVDWHE